MATLMERLEAKLDKSGGPDACWLWTGSRGGSGYGQIYAGAGAPHCLALPHRVAYEMAHGPVPDGMVVMHSCDNRLCCNPRHLSAGTQKENLADMRRKGRERRVPVPRGEGHKRSKLTDAIVAEMRARWAAGETQEHLAECYRIGQSTVSSVVRRETWRHVP